MSIQGTAILNRKSFLDSKRPSRSTESQRMKFSKLLICLSVATSLKSLFAFTHWADWLRSTLNTPDLLLARKWLIRMNVLSPKPNCVPMKANSICRWDSTRELLNPDTVDSATLVTCKSISNYIYSNFKLKLELLNTVMRYRRNIARLK